MELMPEFNSELEFNEYFKRENELCDKYVGDDGALHFENNVEFENLVRQLMPDFQHSFIYE